MKKEVYLLFAVGLVLGIGFLFDNYNITGKYSSDFNKESSEKLFELYLGSDPEQAKIYIDGSYVGQTPLTLTSSNDNMNVILKKFGYYDLEESINLDIDHPKIVRLALIKEGYGILNLKSNIKDADIFINNEIKGFTPSKISLREGIYSIRVSKENFVDFITSQIIKDGQNQQLSANFESNKEVSSLFIESRPSDAMIVIDDKYYANAPSLLNLESGMHNLKIIKHNYDDKLLELNLEKDKREDLIVELQPSLGTLFVSSDPFGSQIYIDGEYKGLTPKLVSGLIPGPRSLRVTKEHYEDSLRTANVRRMYPNSIYVKLNRKQVLVMDGKIE